MRAARGILTGLLLVLMLAGCGGGGGGGGGDSIDPPSGVATLAGLALSAGDLDQAFQSDQFVYTATVGFLTTATTVTPTTTDAAATVTVNGVDVVSGSASASIPLAVGKNTLTVIVTAQDGVTTSTYTVTVTRESPSGVATLAGLALSAGDLDQAFQSDQFVYTATVGFLTTAMTVTPTTTDAAATVTVNGVDVVSGSASASIPLAVGDSILSVIVTAEDGVTTSTYTVTVTRESPSGVATLADLALSADDLDQAFQSDQYDYTATVSFLTTATTVTPTTTDAAATVSVNGVAVTSGSASAPIPLAVGDSILTVIVTAEDGVSTGTYTVTVTRESANEFAQQAYLKASNAGSGDQFGYSVALDGDTLAVGAYREDGIDDTTPQSGAVYVFISDGTGWTQQAYIKASNAGSRDRFGISLALSGNTLAVGAYLEDSSATDTQQGGPSDPNNNDSQDSGAVYVFTRSDGTWTQQAYIKASNTDMGDNFGYSAALSGDTLAVGAYLEDSSATDTQQGGPSDPNNNDSQDSGAVYVFTRSDGTWTQQAYIKASNTDMGDNFGYSAALSGDTLAVGAYLEDSSATDTQQGGPSDPSNNDSQDSGAVYVFTRSDGTWTKQAYIKASNTGTNDVFGWSVALSGDTLAVGAPFEASSIVGDQNDDNYIHAGAVYVFTRDGTTWEQQEYIKASNPGEDDTFGWSLAVFSDTLAVGAKGEASSATSIDGNQGDNSQPNAGAVYLFSRDGTAWTQQAYVKAKISDGVDFFGYSVALSNDIMAVGAPGEDSIDGDPLNNTVPGGVGAAYVFQ